MSGSRDGRKVPVPAPAFPGLPGLPSSALAPLSPLVGRSAAHLPFDVRLSPLNSALYGQAFAFRAWMRDAPEVLAARGPGGPLTAPVRGPLSRAELPLAPAGPLRSPPSPSGDLPVSSSAAAGPAPGPESPLLGVSELPSLRPEPADRIRALLALPRSSPSEAPSP